MNKDIIKELEILRNKGACIYTQPKAEKSLIELKKLLPDNEYNKISIAHSHYLIGEGADELMMSCKELILKYS